MQGKIVVQYSFFECLSVIADLQLKKQIAEHLSKETTQVVQWQGACCFLIHGPFALIQLFPMFY